MKKVIITVVLFLFAINLIAQNLEITPHYGYQFGTKLNYGPNYLKIDDSDQYGITLGMEMASGLTGEITYIHHSTELKIRDILLGPVEERLADLNADWVLLGANKYFKEGKVRPFAGGGLGLVFIAPKNENLLVANRRFDNQTKFTFSFKTGANIMVSEVVGINLQFNMLFPIEWGGFYVGGGTGGFSSGVSVSSSTIIAGFSGGLVFRISPKTNTTN
ncbi:hypothetical protein RXV94_11585 [Yeosuana sp. MJ-SS3]|uniref:Outer membrane protein beta-barrel domain-containing protein n=1 Tax=Gilvirhabdus luticola TaxID=3079858 RepID=A0ABU3U8R4_9FLAO|nr:hypothetical protein [Yeosuana sp. MJ-SS3]MDU8886804.1 hypothetical protein [Yeosuana sp. MJ-SS3]